MSSLLQAATAYVEGGLSVIPVHDKIACGPVLPTRWDEKQRRNVPTWIDFQSRQPTIGELELWFNDPRVNGIAGVGGSVSGNLCVMDFDVPSFYTRWKEITRKHTTSLATPLPTQQTPSGGFQVWFRCPEPGRNQKLAWRSEESGKPEIAIETRATGGYALLPPSMHPNGGRYKAIDGRFEDIPIIDMDLALEILDAARSLSEIKPQNVTGNFAHAGPSLRDRLTVSGHLIDKFNERYTVPEWLLQHGYVWRGRMMCRPGRDAASITITEDQRLSYHFSTNDPLSNTPRPFHDPFSVYQYLVCGGDFKAAMKAAAKLLGIVYHETDDSSTPQITTTNLDTYENAQIAPEDTPFYMADFAGSQTVVLIEAGSGDDRHLGATLLRDLGVSAISGPRMSTWPMVWQDRVSSYKRRYIWFQPPLTAQIEDLALDMDALIVNAAVDPKTFLTEWSGTQQEVLSFLLTAIEPVGRIGARGLWR